MSNNDTLFNTGDVKPSEFDTIPAGTYNAQCTQFEQKPTKKPGGLMLKGRFQILDGDQKGRFVFVNYNIVNQNPTAVEIAQREIKSYLEAIGADGDFAVTMDLLNQSCGQEFVLVVGIEDDDQFGPSNTIKKYLPKSASVPAQAGNTAAATPTGEKRPWEK